MTMNDNDMVAIQHYVEVRLICGRCCLRSSVYPDVYPIIGRSCWVKYGGLMSLNPIPYPSLVGLIPFIRAIIPVTSR